MSIVEVKVPDIGDFKEVEVIELMVKPGDTIKVDQSLVTVESDKASMEIPSSHAGVVKEIKVKVGDKVAEGSLVLMLEEAAAALLLRRLPKLRLRRLRRLRPLPHRRLRCCTGRTSCPAPAAAPAACAGRRTGPAPSFASAHASPSIRKFARELGVDLSRVPGTGPKNRITQLDVQNFVKGVMAARPPRPAAAAPASASTCCHGRRSTSQVRPDRTAAAVAHQEDQRPEPAPQLGHDPARDDLRRSRRHRPGSSSASIRTPRWPSRSRPSS
jgi:pyruvate dehydrogenase E2 component (dihydrolipoamide acetyltransferase)